MRRLLVATGLVPAVFALSGCSGSGSPSAGTPTATQVSPVTTAAASTELPVAATAKPQTAVSVESNPPGDIPDNVAYVAYRNPVGRYSFSHPEGWAETTAGTGVSFTDKLNGVQVQVRRTPGAPTVATATRDDVAALARSQAAFELRTVTAVSVPAGPGVRIVYRRNSAPDPVTGRQYRDEVERYEIAAGGRQIDVELFGPVGSDNVDAYRMMIQSLRAS